MNLKEKYLQDASGLESPDEFQGTRKVGWRSPSNIALIKYWGKMAGQVPRNPSLSFTLSNSFTETNVSYSYLSAGSLELEFSFEGAANQAFENRVRNYLSVLAAYLPFLNRLSLKIASSNSFPHSSGIASSASAMSALALCMVQVERDLFGTPEKDDEFFEKGSFLARLGSGSAARSVYGGFVHWGDNDILDDATDEKGVAYRLPVKSTFANLHDAILITSREKKKISSTQGHRMMEDHPWAKARYQQAHMNLEALHEAILTEDDEKIISIIENEALSLHALMLSSSPGYTLLNSNTWNIIHEIRSFREKSGDFMAFTLDAGPNVHLIYKAKNRESIEPFVKDLAKKYCENEYWINDQLGSGPERIHQL